MKKEVAVENPSNLEDVLESIIAAIFIDSNDYQLTKKIIIDLWQEYIDFI